MNDTKPIPERVADIEEVIHNHTQEIERVKGEHVSLLHSNAALAASRDKLREDLTKDYEMLGRAFDNRVDELKAHITNKGGDNEPLVEAIGEFAKDLGVLLGEALAAQERRIMMRIVGYMEQLIDADGQLLKLIQLSGSRSQ